MTNSLYSRIEAIESFAADVAHELKNPLTSLRSAVETMPLARTPESRARLLAVIEHDVRRLDRLISDVSDASRLDAELQRQDATPVDLVRLLHTVTTVANEVRRDDGVTIKLSFEGPLASFVVPGHDSRLGQVIDNLIENARSFSPPDGSVRITAKRLRNAVEITVDDYGPGIAAGGDGAHLRALLHRPAASGLRAELRPRPVDLAPDRRGAWRTHPRREPHGRVGARARGSERVSVARFVVRLPAIVTEAPPREARVRRDMNQSSTIHASAVLVGARAVLIRGPAGSGKSRLALALIQAGGTGALPFTRLVGDDRVHVEAAHGRLLVRPAETLAGLIEVRGLGIRQVPFERVGRGRPRCRPCGSRFRAPSRAQIRRCGGRRDRPPATCGRAR